MENQCELRVASCAYANRIPSLSYRISMRVAGCELRLRITQCLLLFDRQVADVGVTFVDVNGIVFVEFYSTLGWRTTMVGRFVPIRNWITMFGIGVDDDEHDRFLASLGFFQSVEEAVINFRSLLE